jgi:hypothetical protein
VYHHEVDGKMGYNWSIHPGFLPSTSSTISSFNRRAVRSVVDQIPKQFSLPTAIVEIGDIKQTLNGLFRLSDYGPKTFGALSQAFTSRKISLSKTAADHWLKYQFGIVPLWNDITATLGLDAAVDKRIQQLKDTYGKPTKFRSGGSYTASGLTSFENAGSWPLGALQHRFAWSARVVMRAGGTFTQTLGGLDDVSRRRSAIAAAAGVDNLFQTGWDLIPFSFLADYFTNIGELLGELNTNDTFDGDITLSDTWSTTKITYVSDCQVRLQLPEGKGWTSPASASKMTKVNFQRTSGIPTTLGLTFDTSVNANQLPI